MYVCQWVPDALVSVSVREIIVILVSEQLEALCGVRVRAGAVTYP